MEHEDVIGALETIPKGLVKGLEDLQIRGQMFPADHREKVENSK